MCLLQSQYSATQLIKKEQTHEVLQRFISKKPLQSTRRKSKESPKPRKCANSTTDNILEFSGFKLQSLIIFTLLFYILNYYLIEKRKKNKFINLSTF